MLLPERVHWCWLPLWLLLIGLSPGASLRVSHDLSSGAWAPSTGSLCRLSSAKNKEATPEDWVHTAIHPVTLRLAMAWELETTTGQAFFCKHWGSLGDRVEMQTQHDLVELRGSPRPAKMARKAPPAGGSYCR